MSDLPKSQHIARITNSVYPSHVCPGDYGCRRLQMSKNEDCLLWKLINDKYDKSKWEMVHRTANGLVKIFKIHGIDEESKAWSVDLKNKKCDEGSDWICRGDYPPKVREYTDQRKQLRARK